MTAEQLLEILKQKLLTHDWYYMYSDDSRVYRRGMEQADDIRALMTQAKTLGCELRAKTLYNGHKPNV